MPPAIEASGLTKAFGGVKAVDDLSVSLEAGGILGLIGPNGAGKTTLFSLIAGSLRPDAGTIRIAGESVSREPAHRRIARGLGRTFQIPRPFPLMTVLENVMTASPGQTGERLIANLLVPGRIARQERAEAVRAREILAFLSLSQVADQPARVLSGGQRKLLELARVLMARPRVILLDEPAAGVNPALLDFIVERIVEINRQGVAILIIEHNMELVETLCPRVLVMAEGRRFAEGAPHTVMRDAAVVEAFLGGNGS
ncbi:MAG: ABC transporter ATP-binding protein [Rhizobiaceae bacterium]|nr:MAG: ABC transporter ATP-binding protein [Rhizobiaceae bacterium]